MGKKKKPNIDVVKKKTLWHSFPIEEEQDRRRALDEKQFKVFPHIKVDFDGSCTPNPDGIISIGYTIYSIGIGVGTLLWRCGEIVEVEGKRDSNKAEWIAVTRALQWMSDNKVAASILEIHGDSAVVLNKIRCNKTHRIEDLKVVRSLIEEVAISKFKVQWNPRCQNSTCDSLAAKALKEHQIASITAS